MGFNEMDLLASAAAGMSAQRSVLDIAARNVRLVAQLGAGAESSGDASDTGEAFETSADSLAEAAGGASAAVSVRSEPGTGDALGEMIAVLDAQRAYEQNASIFDTAKRLAERTIDVGRG
jgi:flagellar basal body rod protein FlgC